MVSISLRGWGRSIRLAHADIAISGLAAICSFFRLVKALMCSNLLSVSLL